MNVLCRLPVTAQLGDRQYSIHTDYRDILEIFSYLNDLSLPEFIRWEIALALFYEEPLPPSLYPQAAEFLGSFISGGEAQKQQPGPKLLDWQQDGAMIIADVNRVAGQELRALPYVHWWTFLSWFHSIGEGQLSTVIAIRDKLAKGKKLEEWEKSFYRENRKKVELQKQYTPAQLWQRQQLEQMLEQRQVKNR